MEKPIFSDPDQHPTEEIIFAHLGKAQPLWKELFDYIHANYPDISEEWRYYNDGKSWLMKVTRKKKTIFWLSIVEGAFRTTFYFTDKAEQLIMSSSLSEDLKEQFRAGKQLGKIKGITVVNSAKKHIKDVKALVGIKLKIK